MSTAKKLVTSQARDHYFIRIGSKNHIFDKIYDVDAKSKKLLDKKSGAEVLYCFLPVFWSDFSYKQFKSLNDKMGVDNKEIYKQLKLEPQHLQQARVFFNSSIQSIYWIFIRQHLLAFEQIDSKIYDFEDPDLNGIGKNFKNEDDERTNPKLRRCRLLGVFNRSKAPEIFATTDSSNFRGTVLPLAKGSDREVNGEIAEYLLNDKEKIYPKTRFEMLRYLSPLQLETYFYKLFDSNGLTVSSCRGGSRFRIDLQVLPKRGITNFGPFKFSEEGLLLQIKRTVGQQFATEYLKENTDVILVCLSHLKIEHENCFHLGDPRLLTLVDSQESAAANKWAEEILAYSGLFGFR